MVERQQIHQGGLVADLGEIELQVESFLLEGWLKLKVHYVDILGLGFVFEGQVSLNSLQVLELTFGYLSYAGYVRGWWGLLVKLDELVQNICLVFRVAVLEAHQRIPL